MYDLKSVRKAKRLTGEMVCQSVGCSPSTLSLLETGKRRPSVELAKRLGTVLGFDWTLFFADDVNITQNTAEQEYQDAKGPPDGGGDEAEIYGGRESGGL